MKNSEYHFNIGTKRDIETNAVNSCYKYRITRRVCDCDSAIGLKNPENTELSKYEALLNSLKSVRGIKHIYIGKLWIGKTFENGATAHIDDIDIPHFLADLKDNCLYKIELYKRYYSS